MLKKQLGRRIAYLRKQQKYTQESFAEKTEYSVEFISLVERGVNAPSIEGCERIANVLQIEIKELFDFDKSTD